MKLRTRSNRHPHSPLFPGGSRPNPSPSPGLTPGLPMGFAVALTLLLSACAVRPPHWVGEKREVSRSAPTKPDWTEWSLESRGPYLMISGTATHAEQEKAVAAAEDAARNRLASSLRTRIVSDLQSRVTTSGTVRGGKLVTGQEQHQVDQTIKAFAEGRIEGAEPVETYVETYEEWGGGWQRKHNAWVLVRYPQAEYHRQLGLLRETPAKP